MYKAQSNGNKINEIVSSSALVTPETIRRNVGQSEINLTIFIACYNEEENIIATLGEVISALIGLSLTWEIIVIDDASTDKSVSLIKRYMCGHPDYPIILVVREENQGLAQNYIEAAFLGRGKYYRLVHGDNVENSAQIASILGHIGEAEIVIPYHAQIVGRTLFRIWLSRLFTLLVNLLSGFKIKYYNGCSVLFRHDVMRWHVNCTGFDFQANLIVRLLRQGRTYVEIPVVGGEREFGQSKALTLKNFFSAARFFVDLAFNWVWRVFHS
jgi:glycosyltransferase involved in cell wall biosynthesis